MYVVVVFLEVKPARIEVFREHMKHWARRVMETEPGCLQFDVNEDPELPGSFLLYEVYTDEAAFKAHGETPQFAEHMQVIKDWLSSRKRLTYIGLPRPAAAKLN